MRHHREVIKQIMDKIPETRAHFKLQIEQVYENSFYHAPESKMPWDHTGDILFTWIPIPKEEWEYEVVSIFTMIPIEKLKEKYNSDKN